MRTYTGDQTSSIAVAMAKCDPLGPLMVNVVKLYSTPDGEAFTALGRVYSGAVRTGQKVKVRVFCFVIPRVQDKHGSLVNYCCFFFFQHNDFISISIDTGLRFFLGGGSARRVF